jgi:hypothetical protein
MLGKMPSLGYFDGLQFYCEAVADGLPSSWVLQIVETYRNKVTTEFIKGVSDALSAHIQHKLDNM